MNESEHIAADLCQEVRQLLDAVCLKTMHRFEDKQSMAHRVEFAVVAYMMEGETTVTLSASAAPWGLIATALAEAADEMQEREQRIKPERLQ